MPRLRDVIKTPLYDLVVEGVAERDEVFTTANYGAFNVSRFRRLLAGKPHRFSLMRIPISKEILAYISRFIVVDDKHVKSMSHERRDDPVFMITFPESIQPKYFIIDGHHRILRRHRDRFDYVEAWVMPPRMLEQIIVRHTKIRK